MVRKFRWKLFFILLLLVIVGCSRENTDHLEPTIYESVNNLEGVSLQLIDENSGFTISPTESDDPTPTSLNYYYENNSNKDLTYGQSFILEEKINGKWYQVPTIIEDYGFEDIGYTLKAESIVALTTEWEWLYGNLETGHYRLITEVLDVEEPGSYETYPLAIEFELD